MQEDKMEEAAPLPDEPTAASATDGIIVVLEGFSRVLSSMNPEASDLIARAVKTLRGGDNA